MPWARQYLASRYVFSLCVKLFVVHAGSQWLKCWNGTISRCWLVEHRRWQPTGNTVRPIYSFFGNNCMEGTKWPRSPHTTTDRCNMPPWCSKSKMAQHEQQTKNTRCCSDLHYSKYIHTYMYTYLHVVTDHQTPLTQLCAGDIGILS